MLKTKEQWLMEAINHYNAKCYENCLAACDRAILLDSHYGRAYHGKALALVQQKAYTSALKVYEKASQLAPENTEIHTEVAELFYHLSKFAEYERFYRIAIKLGNKFEAVHIKRSKLAPENAKIQAKVAELFYLKKYYIESGWFYRIAIQLDSRFEAIYSKKTEELTDTASSFFLRYPLTHHNLTIDAYKNVLSFNPDDEVARSELKKIQGEVDLKNFQQSDSFPSTNNYTVGGCLGTFNCRCSKCWEP